MAQTMQPPNMQSNGTTFPGNAKAGDGSVNRKKQKRRQKQAARQALGQAPGISAETSQGNFDSGDDGLNGDSYYQTGPDDGITVNGTTYSKADLEECERLYQQGMAIPVPNADEDYYSDGDPQFIDDPPLEAPNGKTRKKRKNKSRTASQYDYNSGYAPMDGLPSATGAFGSPPPPPPPPPLSTSHALRSAQKVSKDRIWNTSTAEERERIKEFWLSLEEKERRSLVKVEKEAVLRKMKEQQKHSCSCTVCGRKRTAIEEELEVLYDAYYEELEQYANHQQVALDDGAPVMPPPKLYPRSMPGKFPTSGRPHVADTGQPSRGRIQEVMEDEDELDEEDFSDEEDDEEDYSDDFAEEPRGPDADFFNFGRSLTVQGGILTVADDLLKNDGKKFIEMMEQLAERRMQREEEAQYAAAGLRHPSMQGHNHGPPLEDDEYEDEEDDEYDSQDDEDYDEDEMDTMTEEQRMEEGRRMFQIFAARMFEQRVLTAYREKVARERQEKLLEELADESRLDAQREAKKAKEAQKKKDKKQKQKQAKDEEKAKKEADKAAEDAAAKAIEEKKLEEQRQKKEEQRKKKEAEKRAQDEEKQRKEAEKLKRQQELRDQQAEAERKQKEQKERERKRKEEAKRKEREEREAKEREVREKKEREAAEAKQRANAKAEQVAKDRAKREEQAARTAAVAAPPLKRNMTSTAVPIPPGLQQQHSISAQHSPHLPVATPVIPKAPSPVRPRQPSIHGSQHSSPKARQTPSSNSTNSPNPLYPQQKPAASGPFSNNISTFATLDAPSMPASSMAPINVPAGTSSQVSPMASPFNLGPNNMPMNYPPHQPGSMQRGPVGHDSSTYGHQPPQSATQNRFFNQPGSMPYPPGINGNRTVPQTRAASIAEGQANIAAIGLNAIGSPGHQTMYEMNHGNISRTHSRHTSASLDKSTFEDMSKPVATQPIARPAPLKGPLAADKYMHSKQSKKIDVDDLSDQLGSSALLEDSDFPATQTTGHSRRGSAALGGPRSGRIGFAASPMFSDSLGSAKLENFSRASQGGVGNWGGGPHMPFGSPSVPGHQTWSNAPGSGWPSNTAFGIIGGSHRGSVSRPVTIRILASQACRQLSANGATKQPTFHNVDNVMKLVQQMKPSTDEPIQLRDLLDICDTEGNATNGGGSFLIQDEGPAMGTFVKFEPDSNPGMNDRMGGGAPGDIGSPIHTYNGPRPF